VRARKVSSSSSAATPRKRVCARSALRTDSFRPGRAADPGRDFKAAQQRRLTHGPRPEKESDQRRGYRP
jgi:hypothetical protein